MKLKSLRVRVLLGVAIAWCAWSLLEFRLSSGLLETSSAEHERAAGIANVHRLTLYMRFATGALERSSRDWSEWDDTYAFMRGEMPDFPAKNIVPVSFENLRLDVMAFVKPDGEVAAARYIEYADRVEHPMPADLVPRVVEAVGTLGPEERARHGYIGTEDGIFAFAARRIYKSDGTGDPVGLQIFGWFVDSAVIAEIENALGLEADVFRVDRPDLPDDVRAALTHMSPQSPLTAMPIGPAKLASYALLSDVPGQPIGVIRLVSERGAARAAAAKRQQQLVVSMGFGLLIGLMLLLFLERRVLSRLRGLAEGLAGLPDRGGVHGRLPAAEGHDEIDSLTTRINDMLAQLEAQQRLREARDEAVAQTRQKSEFLANMSHEIRTPMNGVLGMLQLLLDTRLPRDQHERVQMAFRSASSLRVLLDDILDFSKLEAGKLAFEEMDFEPGEVIEDAVMLFVPNCEQKGIVISCFVEPAIAGLHRGDPHRFKQVLVNLLGNAVKFTTTGSVSVRATRGPHDGLCIEVADTGIGIADEDLPLLFKPFTQVDASTTRHYGGTGLGLAISSELARRMGGTIEVRSEVGAGSVFTLRVPLPAVGPPVATPVYARYRAFVLEAQPGELDALCAYFESWGLAATRVSAGIPEPTEIAAFDVAFVSAASPLCADHVKAAFVAGIACVRIVHPGRSAADRDGYVLDLPVRAAPLAAMLGSIFAGQTTPLPAAWSIVTPPERPEFSSKRVLLVEDNEVNGLLALSMLESNQIAVELAEDGYAALDLLAANRYDLVLMDCQMPGLDGFEATRRWRTEEAAAGRDYTPIVALTANAMAGDRERCLEAGMDDYLAKPFAREELERMLRIWLSTWPADALPRRD
ncbi:MAG: response regulator [Gammaproteobacteria bacterium]|nr:response regulator [Gammaproteobacteria bacterium]